MANNKKSKIKVLYLLKILQEETNAEHGLTMSQIIERLDAYGIPAERKSIYSDLDILREFDIDIKTYQRNPVEYAIERRDFSIGELMLMVDAIQSCRAITEKQAKTLITNIKQLATNHEQHLLDRRIHVARRIKSQNSSVFHAVDAIHQAIKAKCKIEFSYRKIGLDGKPCARSKSKTHVVTPVAIVYEDGFYYLTAWNEAHNALSEYRLDRMIDLRVLESAPAARNSEIAGFRYDENKAIMFGRFGGEEVVAILAADADKVEIITDRFGSAATFLKSNDQEALARVKICKSEQFFGWIASMGKKVRIAGPESLVKEYHAYLNYLLED